MTVTMWASRKFARLVLGGALSLGLSCGSGQAQVRSGAELHEIVIDGDHLLVVDHISFEFDSDVILENSNPLLNRIAEILAQHEEIHGLDIVGHTDAAGGPEHNQDLSERRAAAVVAALQTREVSQALHSRGVGETERVCTEDTEKCHARNRRVEFKISL